MIAQEEKERKEKDRKKKEKEEAAALNVMNASISVSNWADCDDDEEFDDGEPPNWGDMEDG
eukprot:4444250-Pyramimonas_sp.AAC.1